MMQYRRFGSSAAVVALLAVFAASAGAQQATTYQIDRGHTGTVHMTTPLKAPLKQLWRKKLTSAASYSLIAGGRVFVLANGPTDTNSATLLALNARTGALLWKKKIASTYGVAYHAYGDGRVYVVGDDAHIQAVDAASGAIVWTNHMKGQYASSSAPTYSNGVLYTVGYGSGVTLYAFDGATGNMRWSAVSFAGGDASPAVSDSGVYVDYSCNNVFGYAVATGAQLWKLAGTCVGAGGSTPTLADGLGLLVRYRLGGALVLDPATGAQTGNFGSSTSPAVEGNVLYELSAGALKAHDQHAGKDLWSFAGAGDMLVTAPIVVDGMVLIGDVTGHLFTLDKATGALLGTSKAGPSMAPTFENGPSLAAGEGIVVVPADTYVAAYGN